MGASSDAIEILRQRIDTLEGSSREKAKPWYRQASNMLAMIALAVSIATTLYTQVGSKQESIRSKKEELRKLVINLVDLRQTVLKGAGMPEGAQVQSASRQQRVYLQGAERLVGQIPQEVSSYEYAVLAEELEGAGELPTAEDYFNRAVGASTSTSERVQALGSLATYYFTPGPRANIDKGRSTFENANRAVGDQSDPYAIIMKASNFENWAAVEYLRGFSSNGTARLNDARNCYMQLPENYPNRAFLINDLDRRVHGRNPISPEPFGSNLNVPPDLAHVLQEMSADDLRSIVEKDVDDGGTILIGESKDEKQNLQDRERYQRFVNVGLGAFMSNAEVKREARKDNTHYDYGFRANSLYPRLREFIFLAIASSLSPNPH